MRIYTASSFHRYRDVRAFNKRLRELGHEITHDWTLGPEFDENGDHLESVPLNDEERAFYAMVDFMGVQNADMVIFLDDERANGGRWECGMAAGAAKKVWIVDERCRVIFDGLPWVEKINSSDEALSLLEDLRTVA